MLSNPLFSFEHTSVTTTDVVYFFIPSSRLLFVLDAREAEKDEHSRVVNYY